MVWKDTVSPYRIILGVTIVWIQEKGFLWIILRLDTNMLDAFFIVKYMCLFLTVNSGGRGEEDFFFRSLIFLVFIYRMIFPHSFPPSFS